MTNLSKKRFLLLTLLLAFTAATGAHSQTLYVDTAGNDRNPGTRDRPLATVEAALEHMRHLRKESRPAGPATTTARPAMIIIGRGTYLLDKPLTFNGEDSGSEESSLVIRGEGPERPVLSGGMPLPPFEKVSENLWRTQLPADAPFHEDLGQLFVNGKRATRARTPDAGTFFKTGKVIESPAGGDSGEHVAPAIQKIALTREQGEVLKRLSSAEISETIISVHHAWDRTRKHLRNFDAGAPSVSIAGKLMHPWNTLDNSSQFYFENARAFLNAPGEWFLDKQGTLFYVPRDGERPESSHAVVPVHDQLLVLQGTESAPLRHVRFENLSFRYSRYQMPDSGNEPAQAAAPTTAAVMLDHVADIHLNNCEIAHTGNNAIWFRANCRNSGIRSSYLHDLGIGGVKIGPLRSSTSDEASDATPVTRNITVDNNIIRSGGYEFPTGVGVIIFHGSDNTISHNEIADFRYSGVSVGWVWGYSGSVSKRNKIVYNHIHHLGWGELSDMGGVYTLGLSEGTEVSNNVIHHIYSYGYGGWGLYTDEGSTGIRMENNLVYRCKSSGFHQHYGKDNIIQNNIFAFQLKAQLEATRVEEHRSFIFKHNIVYFDSGALIGKPGWVNARFEADSNLYYDVRSPDIRFWEMDFSHWQDSTGKDLHSVIADPGFRNAASYDFRFRNKKAASGIGFKPFDYREAGVYGDKKWKKLAGPDPGLALDFDRMVAEREQQE